MSVPMNVGEVCFITVGGIHLIWLFDLGLFMSIIASKIMSLSLLPLVCKTPQVTKKKHTKNPKRKSNLLDYAN